jgi:hypothetical protein
MGQTPMTKPFGAWGLVLIWSLEFGELVIGVIEPF